MQLGPIDMHMCAASALVLQVCVVGKIMTVHDRNTSIVVVLSDGTGELEVNHWLNEESEHVSWLDAMHSPVGSMQSSRRARLTAGNRGSSSTSLGRVGT